jgi:hypothetical protein
MNETRRNVFQRYAYSPRYNYTEVDGINTANQGNNMVVFSGGDMQAYINNIKVGNLESVTWSISVEVVGNYVMGRRDAVIYTTGKRVVVGSMVLSQYDRHALLEQVFQISRRKITSIGSLWGMDKDTRNRTGQPGSQDKQLSTVPGGTGVNPEYVTLNRDQEQFASGANATLLRGISRTAYEQELRRMETDAARSAASVKFNYSDQLPPFDLTLVGVTKGGDAARCSIFGMQVTQETAGFSQNDLGNSVGMSFVGLAVSPWRSIDDSALELGAGTNGFGAGVTVTG